MKFEIKTGLGRYICGSFCLLNSDTDTNIYFISGFSSYLDSNPRNKNVEKWNGRLKFEVTGLELHSHKITGQF